MELLKVSDLRGYCQCILGFMKYFRPQHWNSPLTLGILLNYYKKTPSSLVFNLTCSQCPAARYQHLVDNTSSPAGSMMFKHSCCPSRCWDQGRAGPAQTPALRAGEGGTRCNIELLNPPKRRAVSTSFLNRKPMSKCCAWDLVCQYMCGANKQQILKSFCEIYTGCYKILKVVIKC